MVDQKKVLITLSVVVGILVVGLVISILNSTGVINVGKMFGATACGIGRDPTNPNAYACDAPVPRPWVPRVPLHPENYTCRLPGYVLNVDTMECDCQSPTYCNTGTHLAAHNIHHTPVVIPSGSHPTV
jgi:hypothetical protein